MVGRRGESDAATVVDDYIARLPDWQQDICRQLRELIHAADPEVEETIRRSVQPYMSALAEDGFLLVAGPLAGSEHARVRVLLVVDAEDTAEIDRR
jgi:hypothetical protein